MKTSSYPASPGGETHGFIIKSFDFVQEAKNHETRQGFCLAVALLPDSSTALTAEAGGTAPSKVLVVTREFLKPGRGGSPHENTESALVKAMAGAKWPTRYIGIDALSGASQDRSRRALDHVGRDVWT